MIYIFLSVPYAGSSATGAGAASVTPVTIVSLTCKTRSYHVPMSQIRW